MRTSFHPYLGPLLRPLLRPPSAPFQPPPRRLPPPQTLGTPATTAYGVHQHNGRTPTLARQSWVFQAKSNQVGIKLILNRLTGDRVAGDRPIPSRMAQTSVLQISRHNGKTLARINGKAPAGISLICMLRAFGSSPRQAGSRVPGITSSRAVGEHPNRPASTSPIRALGTSLLIQIPLPSTRAAGTCHTRIQPMALRMVATKATISASRFQG